MKQLEFVLNTQTDDDPNSVNEIPQSPMQKKISNKAIKKAINAVVEKLGNKLEDISNQKLIELVKAEFDHNDPPSLKEISKDKSEKESSSTNVRNATNALTDRDLYPIPSGIPYHDTQYVFSHKDLFEKSEDSIWPTARIQRNNSISIIQYKPDTPNKYLPLAEEQALAEQMWEHSKVLSDLDADCLDALMAIWLTSAQTPDQSVPVHVDHLLELRGLGKKLGGTGYRGGFWPEQRKEMLNATFRIENIWIEFEGPISQGKGKKPKNEVIRSRAIVISDLKGQRRIDGDIDVNAFLYKPGRVFAQYMWGEGRQTALLAAQALNYDPYRQGPEKRLTRYFAWQWKIRARQGNYAQSFSVNTLLDEANITIEAKNPLRTKERLEKALDQLHDHHVINNWQYDKSSFDDDFDSYKRGWFQKWQTATILIEPPDTIRDYYYDHGLERSFSKTKQENLQLPPTTLGEDLAKERKNRKLSQTVIAELFEVSQAYINQIERGKANISKNLGEKISKWLSEPPNQEL